MKLRPSIPRALKVRFWDVDGHRCGELVQGARGGADGGALGAAAAAAAMGGPRGARSSRTWRIAPHVTAQRRAADRGAAHAALYGDRRDAHAHAGVSGREVRTHALPRSLQFSSVENSIVTAGGDAKVPHWHRKVEGGQVRARGPRPLCARALPSLPPLLQQQRRRIKSRGLERARFPLRAWG